MNATASFRKVKPGGGPDWIAGPPSGDGPMNPRPRIKRPPLPRVLWLAEPRRLHGSVNVVGVMSDAPAELREAWGVA